MELVSDWYMREADPAKRVLTPTPRLYQKYIGHDNNRDFFMSAMRETTNLNCCPVRGLRISLVATAMGASFLVKLLRFPKLRQP